MTRRVRRNHSVSFKAKVALATLIGDKTLAEEYDLHPNQITGWKQQLGNRSAELFGKTTDLAVYRKPNTSKNQPGQNVYSSLLRTLTINRPNQ